jgi:hypothetical protein
LIVCQSKKFTCLPSQFSGHAKPELVIELVEVFFPDVRVIANIATDASRKVQECNKVSSLLAPENEKIKTDPRHTQVDSLLLELLVRWQVHASCVCARRDFERVAPVRDVIAQHHHSLASAGLEKHICD